MFSFILIFYSGSFFLISNSVFYFSYLGKTDIELGKNGGYFLLGMEPNS